MHSAVDGGIRLQPQAEFEAMPLFGQVEAERRLRAMHDSIEEVSRALRTLRGASPWDIDLKVIDEFLTPLFKTYFGKLKIENLMLKKSFYELADCVPKDEIDPEVSEKLDAIADLAESAKPSQQ